MMDNSFGDWVMGTAAPVFVCGLMAVALGLGAALAVIVWRDLIKGDR